MDEEKHCKFKNIHSLFRFSDFLCFFAQNEMIIFLFAIPRVLVQATSFRSAQ